MKPKVFVPDPIADAGLELLESEVECVTPWVAGREMNDDEGRALLSASDAVIVRLYVVRREDLERSPRLKVIAKHGVGVDNIDVAAAAEKGVPVVYTPIAKSNAVAEHAIALMLALARQIDPAAQAIREGRFSDRSQYQGVELAGKTLGVIGLGRIGMRVSEIAALGLGLKVVAYDPFLAEQPKGAPVALADSMAAVVRQADFLTLHVPLTSATRHLIDGETLRLMKSGCRIVNTSRGAVVDERALVKALTEGWIAGAALDVFEKEPIPRDHPLVTAPNILLTPHISSSTKESLDRMAVDAAQGVLDVLGGRDPQFPYLVEAKS
ncbi:MAG: hydroxyacid dehydrogenase [Alphaproteobacteria bacterium]